MITLEEAKQGIGGAVHISEQTDGRIRLAMFIGLSKHRFYCCYGDDETFALVRYGRLLGESITFKQIKALLEAMAKKWQDYANGNYEVLNPEKYKDAFLLSYKLKPIPDKYAHLKWDKKS